MPSGVKGFSLWLHGKSTETLEEVLLPVCHWLPPPFAPGSLRSICTGAAADLRPASLLWDNPADFQPNCTRWSTKAEMQRGCQAFSLSVSLLAALSFVSTNYTNFSKWFIDAKLLHTFLFKLFVWSIVLLKKEKKIDLISYRQWTSHWELYLSTLTTLSMIYHGRCWAVQLVNGTFWCMEITYLHHSLCWLHWCDELISFVAPCGASGVSQTSVRWP